ncbi:trypsin-like peptidase domain-containing protein [Pedobacter nyackensis]|uniref:Serine protease Do n=1 Tax=Pedobacter nyackensis TaxID=475255 RepID=A0A1W2D028_9SPHI|nr:trypsin-like peptidase domain-containing protein [Pedobacter nyackensis]SMC90811.1 serine protease Do [Pedobacter nyackensis]
MNLKKNIRKNAAILAAVTLLSPAVFAQKLDVNKLQEELKATVNKVLPASVFLIDYNPGPLVYSGYRASGVVVKDGMILTAGHATTIGKKYRVVFPDGKECVATGVGKISDVDAGLLRIDEKGDWPFVEMGSSSSLSLYQPCFSIAYPGGFRPKETILRFGHVAEMGSEKTRGKIRTTCLMEPGDSGGPVFDLDGRVVGIRSSILLSLESNFEIPVDVYRAYWTALKKEKTYEVSPYAEKNELEPVATLKSTIKNVAGLEKGLNGLEAKLDDYSVKINSSLLGIKASVLGTVIATKGLPGSLQKVKGLVVSKSSMVGDTAMITLANGKSVAAKVLARDEEKDLVLLQLDNELKKGINIAAISQDTLSLAQLGDFLLSPSPDDDGELSLIGSRQFNLGRTYTNPAFLGAGFEKVDGRVVIRSLVPLAPAEAAKLMKGDEIVSVNDVKITEPGQFTTALRDKKPNDLIVLVTVRDGVESSISIKLGKRPLVERRQHIAEKFTDGKSERRDGFKNVFVHDGKIKPAECGGPLFDLNEKFIGMNLARYSRTSSIAVVALELKKFIEANSNVLVAKS